MFNKSFLKKSSKYLALASIGIVTFGVIALADYVEPVSTAPNSNTPEVLKTTSITALTYEKLGIGDGDKPDKINNRITNSMLSYALLGTKSDKFITVGSNIIRDDFIIMVDDKNNKGFDQYINSGVEYSKFISRDDVNNKTNYALTTSKPLETLFNGRYVSKFAITDFADRGKNITQNPNYSLDFQTTSSGSSSFSPTTNIGLGDSRDLYPVDIGTTVGDGGGCPAGSYISYYKQPTFSGTLSATNNTNSQTVATCTQFNPSVNPKNTGRCTSKVFTNLNYVEKVTGTPVCTYYAASSISYGGGINLSSFKGKNAKVKWYNGGTYTPSLDNKTTFTYGCGSGPWKVIATDDYGQYAEGEE